MHPLSFQDSIGIYKRAWTFCVHMVFLTLISGIKGKRKWRFKKKNKRSGIHSPLQSLHALPPGDSTFLNSLVQKELVGIKLTTLGRGSLSCLYSGSKKLALNSIVYFCFLSLGSLHERTWKDMDVPRFLLLWDPQLIYLSQKKELLMKTLYNLSTLFCLNWAKQCFLPL